MSLVASESTVGRTYCPEASPTSPSRSPTRTDGPEDGVAGHNTDDTVVVQHGEGSGVAADHEPRDLADVLGAVDRRDVLCL
jgi:hypothetical protein